MSRSTEVMYADVIFMRRNPLAAEVSGPCHQYLVIAEPVMPDTASNGTAVASVLAVSAELLSRGRYPLTFEVSQGGVRAALDMAVDALMAQPCNEGLELFIREA